MTTLLHVPTGFLSSARVRLARDLAGSAHAFTIAGYVGQLGHLVSQGSTFGTFTTNVRLFAQSVGDHVPAEVDLAHEGWFAMHVHIWTKLREAGVVAIDGDVTDTRRLFRVTVLDVEQAAPREQAPPIVWVDPVTSRGRKSETFARYQRRHEQKLAEPGAVCRLPEACLVCADSADSGFSGSPEYAGQITNPDKSGFRRIPADSALPFPPALSPTPPIPYPPTPPVASARTHEAGDHPEPEDITFRRAVAALLDQLFEGDNAATAEQVYFAARRRTPTKPGYPLEQWLLAVEEVVAKVKRDGDEWIAGKPIVGVVSGFVHTAGATPAVVKPGMAGSASPEKAAAAATRDRMLGLAARAATRDGAA